MLRRRIYRYSCVLRAPYAIAGWARSLQHTPPTWAIIFDIQDASPVKLVVCRFCPIPSNNPPGVITIKRSCPNTPLILGFIVRSNATATILTAVTSLHTYYHEFMRDLCQRDVRCGPRENMRWDVYCSDEWTPCESLTSCAVAICSKYYGYGMSIQACPTAPQKLHSRGGPSGVIE